MDISNFVDDKNIIADVLTARTFWIGENLDIEVEVNLYKDNDDTYKLTSWLGGCEELNTIEYKGSIENEAEVLSAMEKLIYDNEDYILDIASEEE